MHHVELASRAARDLRKLKDARARRDIVGCLRNELNADPHPKNMNIKALRGNAPWLRVRCGEHRVIFRSMAPGELKAAGTNAQSGYLVARIVDRADLERAVKSL